MYAQRTFIAVALAASLAGTLGAASIKAPADEYFGPLKMSLLGLNNVFKDALVSAGSGTTDAVLMAKVDQAADSLRDWARKYPNDPQLGRSYFLGFEIYSKIRTLDAQQQAWHFLNIIVQRWPQSYFGRLARKDVDVGFTERYYAAAEPCPTPSPSPAPTASPSPTAAPTPTPTPSPPPHRGLLGAFPPVHKQTPSPSPSPTPSPTASPSPSPTPAPTPTPEPPHPGQVVIEILPAPCVK